MLIMKNDLFNQTLLRKYSKDFNLTPSKYDLLVKHIEKLEEGQFESETKNYIYFYEVWLKDVLGYDLEDNILFDEKEGEGPGKSEFILKSGDKKFMVVELKDQKTDLDKPQNRVNDKRTPVDQAFDYAQHTGDIDWILVSNYNEFRLYNWHKKGHYISFTAKELLDKSLFSYFMLSFSKKSYIDTGYIDRLMDKTVVIERELEKEFYKLYNETRLMLIKEFEEINELSRLESIHYSQMIMNRYMFICFAEDIDLLPAQVSTDTILTPILKGNLRHGSIWQRLNELFLDIDEGNEYKKISQYNGGIFKEDLDHLKIRDIVEDPNFFKDVYQGWKFKEYEQDVNSNLGPYGSKVNPIYRNMLTISTFDFSTELDVNILGHIFENSIGDIEELKEDSKGRRKKEGIFYTPEYITDYICKNTIIPYLSKSGKSNTIPNLMAEYRGSAIEELDHKVKNIKIVDPACGSGAFLNKASDLLLEIHQVIHETRYKDKKETLKPYFDNIGQRREILLNNIYGVDLNEESVDTTKLSLFLKVCRRGLKLPNLDKNIKCGNSLIEDPKYTVKPFKWENEFPEIFSDGGFDLVIGNPPYGIFIEEDVKNYYSTHFPLTRYKTNLYVLFIERILQIFKSSIVHLIIPKSLLFNTYHDMIRKELLLKTEINEILQITEKVFADAEVGSSLLLKFTLKKNPNRKNCIKFKTIEMIQNLENQTGLEENLVVQEYFLSVPHYEISFLSSATQELLTKLLNFKTINDFYKIKNGLNPGNIKHILISNKKETSFFKPIIWGRDVTRYDISWSGQYVNYDKRITSTISIADLQSKPGMKKQNKVDLRWRTPDIFENEKIIIRKTGDSLICCYDDKNFYFDTLVHGIYPKDNKFNLKFLLAVLNSNPATYFYRLLHDIKGKIFAKISIKNLGMFPLPEIGLDEQQPFIERADVMLHLNIQLQDEIKGFKHWIKKEFHVEKPSKKLEKYYELSMDEFIIEMRKQKVNTKSRKNREYLEQELIQSITIINPLLLQIKETNDEIDQMVYDLYGLTEEEIKIIEESLV